MKLSVTDQFQHEYEERLKEIEAAGLPKDEASMKALAAAAEKYGKTRYTTCTAASQEEEGEDDDDDEDWKISYYQFGRKEAKDAKDDDEEEEEEEEEEDEEEEDGWLVEYEHFNDH